MQPALSFAQFLKLLRYWLGRFTAWTSGIYIVALITLAVFTHWWAEYNLFTAFVAYLPPFLLLVPLLVLLPLSALTRVVWFGALLGAGCLFLWLYGGFRLSPRSPFPGESSAGQLKVLSYNIGQNGKTSLKPFLKRTMPDVLVLQDAGRRADRYSQDVGYAAWPYVAQETEYVLLSRHSVVSKNSIQTPFPKKGAAQTISPAARFVISWEGKLVSIYAVHFPTPRDVLQWYGRRGTFLYGIIGVPGTKLALRRNEYQAYWNARVRMAEELVKAMAEDPNPKVLAGDLNAPGHGAVYFTLRSHLQDGHVQAGEGFGFTFPGDTRNPFTLSQPWLRLDQIMADDKWVFKAFVTEEHRRSQHLAVCAALAFRTSP